MNRETAVAADSRPLHVRQIERRMTERRGSSHDIDRAESPCSLAHDKRLSTASFLPIHPPAQEVAEDLDVDDRNQDWPNLRHKRASGQHPALSTRGVA